MQIYAAITKAEQRMVFGIASTETLDMQPGVWDGTPFIGDIVDPAAIEDALPDYLEYANIREMHGDSAAGTAVTAEVIDGQLHLAVRVVDDGAWKKVVERVYKGFSIGGKILKAVLEKLPDGRYVRRILKLLLTEISLVDRPANPDARILVFKREADMLIKDDATPEAPVPGADTAAIMAELRKLVGTAAPLAKASADPTKIVAMIQAARNELELAGDMDGASLMTQAIALVQQASGEANEPEPADEPAPDPAAEPAADEAAMAMAAKAKKLRKAGRAISGDRVGAMHTVVKTLLQLLAGTGDAVAQKALGAYGPADDGAEKIAKAAQDAADALTPIAKVLVHLADRVEHLEQRPAPGGPVLRAVQKVIGMPKPEPAAQPATAGSVMLAHMAADLLQKARTAATPAARAEFQRQYDELTK